jgi:hypothetical protein
VWRIRPAAGLKSVVWIALMERRWDSPQRGRLRGGNYGGFVLLPTRSSVLISLAELHSFGDANSE